MNENKEMTPPSQESANNDVNNLAREEFLHLIKTDRNLAENWKETTTSLLLDKFPENLEPLKKLVEGVSDVKVEKN